MNLADNLVTSARDLRVINIVDALPKGPTGKILKREIALTVDQARATEV